MTTSSSIKVNAAHRRLGQPMDDGRRLLFIRAGPSIPSNPGVAKPDKRQATGFVTLIDRNFKAASVRE
jgi:hypothetical protein